MRIRATVVKALAAGALLAGVVGVAGAQIASAVTINNYYVAKNGSDVANSCTNKAAPCATVAHAVAQADLVNPSGPNTINVSKGTYTGGLSLTGQTNLTLVGQATKSGKNKVTITGSDPVATLTGNTNTVVSNVNLVGAGAPTQSGVVINDGSTLQNSSLGASSAPTYGINAATGGTVNNVTVEGAICTDVTKSGVAASAPVGTLVTLSKALPKCAGALSASPVSATVVVGNTPTTVTDYVNQAGKKGLELTTANGGTAIPAGTTLSFASTVEAYSSVGALCGGTCVVENSTLDGSGAANQAGIDALQGATVTGNKVNGNGGAGISAAVPASGTITIGGVASGAGNSGSSNEVGISLTGPGSGGTVSVVDNSVGGVELGLAASGLVGAGNTISGNTFSESAEEGVGLLGIVVNNTTFTNNTINGTIAAVIGGAGGNPSDGNTFTGNTISGLLDGLVVPGAADSVDATVLLSQFGVTGAQANVGNHFTNNTVSGSAGANLVDFNAFNGQVTPTCGTLSTTSAITAGTTITSVNVHSTSTCTLNPGATLVNGGLTEELYVTSPATVLSSATSTPVTVSNFIPLASAQLNSGLGSGQTLNIDGESNAVVGANTYTTNSCSPDFNGSSTLDTATGSAGYYSC